MSQSNLYNQHIRMQGQEQANWDDRAVKQSAIKKLAAPIKNDIQNQLCNIVSVQNENKLKQENLVEQQKKNKQGKIQESNNKILSVIESKPFDKQKLSSIRKSEISAYQICKMQIASHEIIANDEDSTSLCQSLTCPICLMILQLPYYECQSCSNGFCTPCLQSWWKKQPKTCVFKCQNADFKQVKRSNTYNAVIGLLKTNCRYCQQQFTIAEIANHLAKSCSEVPEFCRFCEVKLPRKLIQQHENQSCEERPWTCPHCQIIYSYNEHEIHESGCQQRIMQCPYAGCISLPKQKQLAQHIKICNHRLLECQWCHQTLKQVDHKSHIQSCDSRRVGCPWCNSQLKIKEYNEHQIKCELRKDCCQLCREMVLISETKQHRLQCMFANLLEIKNKNDVIERQNVRLKEKVIMLQGILQQTISNSKNTTLKVVSQMREQEKKAMEKDLLRLDNSIKSVQKLMREQYDKHKKFPHLIQSWCPICKQLDRKFNAMLQPLVEQRKQLLTKIAQAERYDYTPK